MKKVFVVLIVLVCASLGFARAGEPNAPSQDGIAVSLMTQTNGPSTFNARISYRIGLLAPFIGTEIRLRDKPDTFDFGTKVFSPDIVEPNAIPILSDLLLPVLNESLVLQGYAGFHSTINVTNKGSYYGSLAGIEAKDNPASPLSVIAELQLNNIGSNSDLEEEKINDKPVLVGLKYQPFNRKDELVVLAAVTGDRLGITARWKF